MSKRLWVARVEFEMVVLAADEEEARCVAEHNICEELSFAGTSHAIAGVRLLPPQASLPHPWEGDCIPWGEEQDRTIAEIHAAETT